MAENIMPASNRSLHSAAPSEWSPTRKVIMRNSTPMRSTPLIMPTKLIWVGGLGGRGEGVVVLCPGGQAGGISRDEQRACRGRRVRGSARGAR
eukprot:scaffold4434_cov109-Isochrysis_galbana.AAC.10